MRRRPTSHLPSGLTASAPPASRHKPGTRARPESRSSERALGRATLATTRLDGRATCTSLRHSSPFATRARPHGLQQRLLAAARCPAGRPLSTPQLEWGPDSLARSQTAGASSSWCAWPPAPRRQQRRGGQDPSSRFWQGRGQVRAPLCPRSIRGCPGLQGSEARQGRANGPASRALCAAAADTLAQPPIIAADADA